MKTTDAVPFRPESCRHMGAAVELQNARLKYFDVAKALAIIAVITGHTAIRYASVSPAGFGAPAAIALTFSFHLPLFFIVSGYFLHIDRPFAWQHEFKMLAVPYIATAVAVVLGIGITNLVYHDSGSTKQLLLDWANAALYGAGDIPANPLWPQPLRIGAIWFLLALFWSRLVTVLAYKANKLTPVVVATVFVVSLFSVRYIFLPLSIQAGLAATPFVYLGSLFKKHDFITKASNSLPCLAISLLVWGWAVFGFKGWGMAMAAYGTTILDVARNCLGGAASSLFVLCLCKKLETKLSPNNTIWNALAMVGTITLPIMCVHLFEDDVYRWGAIIGLTAAHASYPAFWLFVNLCRLVIDILIAWAIHRLVGLVANHAFLPGTFLATGKLNGFSAGKPTDSSEKQGPLTSFLKGCVILFTGLSALLSVAVTTHTDYVESTFTFTFRESMPVIAAACILLAFLALNTPFRLFQKVGRKRAKLALGVIAFILSLAWLLTSRPAIDFDSRDLLEASKYLLGDPSGQGWWLPGAYLERHPYQSPMVVLLALFNAISFGHGAAVCMLMNCVSASVALIALLSIVEMLDDSDRTYYVCFLMCVTCFPVMLYSTFVYANSVSMALAFSAMYLQMKAFSSERKRFVVGAVACAVLAVVLKSSILLVMVAISVVWAIVALKKKAPLYVVPIIAMFVLKSLTMNGIYAVLENATGTNLHNGVPQTAYLVMGTGADDQTLDLNKPGWYSAYTWTAHGETGYDPEWMAADTKELLKTRIATFVQHPGFALKFFAKKYLYEWTEPTYESIMMSNWAVGTGPVPMSAREIGGVARSMYYGKLGFLVSLYCDVLQAMVLAGAFLCVLKNKSLTIWGMAPALFAAGGALLYIFWEAKSQYTLPLACALIPYAAIGIHGLLKVISEGQNKRAGVKL